MRHLRMIMVTIYETILEIFSCEDVEYRYIWKIVVRGHHIFIALSIESFSEYDQL